MTGRIITLCILTCAVIVTASCAASRPAKQEPEKTAVEKKEAPAGKVMPEPEPLDREVQKPPETEKPPEAPEKEAPDAAEALTEEEYKELAQTGKAVMEAHKMYMEYFNVKQRGTIDTVLLDRAIARCDALLPKLEKLIDKYLDSPAVQEYYKTAIEDRKNLIMEK